jgi:hypothetical protein
MYYPPYNGVVAASVISFGAGIAVGAIWGGGWHGWGWNAGWGNHAVVVNNNFIRQNNFNRSNIANGNRWAHNPAHRGGVPYGNRNVSNQFNNARGNNAISRPTAAQTQQRLNQMGQPGNLPGQGGAGRGMAGQGAANRMQMNPGMQNQIGNRNINPSGSANRSAFGGMNQGGNRSVMNSNRGAASRQGSFGGGGRGGGGFRGGGGRGGGGRGGGRRR